MPQGFLEIGIKGATTSLYLVAMIIKKNKIKLKDLSIVKWVGGLGLVRG